MLCLRTPTDHELRDMLAGLKHELLRYPHVGATAGELPAGFHHDRAQVSLGPEPDAFDRARQALLGWRVHRGAGISVYPANAPLSPDADAILVVPLGPVRAVAGCRIVYVVDQADRFGFGYGTLPGHPEEGEEAFMVARHSNVTWFSVTAFSRPANQLVRIGSPVGRLIQRRFVRRYLAAMTAALA